MGVNRDLQKFSMRVTPRNPIFDAFTILSSHIESFNPGEKKDTVEHSEPSLDGSVSTTVKKNKSRDSSSITIKTGTSSAARLDELSDEDEVSDIVMIDESSDEYKQEMVGTDVYFKDPGSPFEDSSKEYTMMIGSFERKRV